MMPWGLSVPATGPLLSRTYPWSAGEQLWPAQYRKCDMVSSTVVASAPAPPTGRPTMTSSAPTIVDVIVAGTSFTVPPPARTRTPSLALRGLRASVGGQAPSGVGGGEDGGQVELLHAEDRLHAPGGAALVGAGQHLLPAGRDDLPRQAVPILQPAADTLLAALGELPPVVVDLGLVRAVDEQRNRLAELELGAAVDAGVLLAVEQERHGHHRADPARRAFGVVRHGGDLGVREDRHVELGGLEGLGVEPEVGGDPGHGGLLSVGRAASCPF